MPSVDVLERAEARSRAGILRCPSKARWARQCTSKTRHGRRQGRRCGQWAIPGGYVCVNHGGRLPVVRAAARRRLEMMLPKAWQVLSDLLEADDKRVRLATAKYVHAVFGIKPEPAQRKSRARGQEPLTVPDQIVLDAIAELEAA